MAKSNRSGPGRGPRASGHPAPRPSGLLAEILFDPERDHCPGSRPVVSLTPDDEAEYKRSVAERSVERAQLRRRGVDHGDWAALTPDGIVPRIQGRKRRVVAWRMRWNAARPLILPALLEQTAARWLPAAGANDALFAKLDAARRASVETAGVLRDQLGSRVALGSELPLADPERDLARIALPGPEGADPWLKLGRLSTHPDDRSLRLRISFGAELDDDASEDEARHRLVRDLALDLLPGGRELLAAERLAPLEEIAEQPLYGTQPIVYWNAPQGGALFHHDAFAGPADEQQRGVLYVQLSGKSAWIGIAIGDLALRVREYLAGAAAAADDDDDKAKAKAGPENELRSLAANWSALVAELGAPGCGRLGALVNDPEMTAFLADSGHAAILSPGDAIVLPNFGLERTAMHSVFCASREVGTGLSMALRTDRERLERWSADCERQARERQQPPRPGSDPKGPSRPR